MKSPGPGQDAEAQSGYEVLRSRVDALPALLSSVELRTGVLGVDPCAVRRFLVTGIGSSAAHARYLAALMSQSLGFPAAFIPTGQLQALPMPGSERDVLIVFSQGLSPNARFAVSMPGRFAEVVLFTAFDPDQLRKTASPEAMKRRQFLEELLDRGVRVVSFPGQDEYGTLVRVIGPMLGYAAAFGFVRDLAPAGSTFPSWDIQAVQAGLARAAARVDEDFPRSLSLADTLGRELTLVAEHGYGEMIQNLATKVHEGMDLPRPPIFDLLEFAHGGYQRLASREATLLVARPAGCGEEGLRRLHRLLDRERHRVRVLDSALEPALAVFEHEAYFNELLLRFIEETGRDPREWPGKGRDGALYDWSPESLGDEARVGMTPASVPSSPELEKRLGSSELTAVIALGSTEQHGPHLPLSTDTDIAWSLAQHFCARVEEAVVTPAVALGVAPEHMEFAGTLSLGEDTFQAVLLDLVTSLSRHGFARVFVFSAHGGNTTPLSRCAPRLQRAAPGLQVIVFDAWDEVLARCHDYALEGGIASEAAGHHAGEIETSIMASIRPGAVRWGHLAPGPGGSGRGGGGALLGDDASAGSRWRGGGSQRCRCPARKALLGTLGRCAGSSVP